ncbi:MAG: hypothetical protein COB42_05840 [Sulfurimonas sp.]|nr:MAG: hypothetical protein COB42_05840 [Sulfurimonas sp.]
MSSKKRAGIVVLSLLIFQLYSPLLNLWDVRSFYYENGLFQEMISKKFIEKNKEKIKNRIIVQNINSILISFNSYDKKQLNTLKTLSKEKLEKMSIDNPDIYYYTKGILYFIGAKFNSNFQQNFVIAYESFKKANKITNNSNIKDDTNIRTNEMLMYGIGTNSKPKLAFKNYLDYKTKNTDFKEYNQFMIGQSYLLAKGTEQNFNKAYKHFVNAGSNANKMLAFMYSSGLGVEKDIDKSLSLMDITDNKNFNKAMIYISNSDYTKGKYHLKKCRQINKKCQKTYYAIYKYDYYDKVLNIMSFI